MLPLVLLAGCHHASFPGYPASYREFAYVANEDSNTVTILDLVYLRADRTVRVGENPVAMVSSPTRPEVYVLNRQNSVANGSISVIETQSNAVVATVSVHRNPVALSVDPTGHRAYVANEGSSTLSVLDLDIRRPIATYSTAAHPGSALISPDGRTLLVTHPESGSVSVFAAAAPDASGPSLTLRASFQGCAGAASPVILPDSSKAFIACPTDDRVLVLSLAADPATWAAKQDASLITDHALALLRVGRSPQSLTMKPDGGEVFVLNTASGSISEISTTTNEVGNTFPIGNLPTQAVVSSDNAELWVANAGADALSLYSIEDGKLVLSLHTGASPTALAFSTDPAGVPGQRMLLATDKRSGDVAVIRTNGRLGPALFTILPAGSSPGAIMTASSTR